MLPYRSLTISIEYNNEFCPSPAYFNADTTGFNIQDLEGVEPLVEANTLFTVRNRDHRSVEFIIWVGFLNYYILSWRKAYHLEWYWGVIRSVPFCPMPGFLSEF